MWLRRGSCWTCCESGSSQCCRCVRRARRARSRCRIGRCRRASVRALHRHRMGIPAARARLSFRDDLLAAVAGLGRGQGARPAAQGVVGRVAGSRVGRLAPGDPGRLTDSRQRDNKPSREFVCLATRWKHRTDIIPSPSPTASSAGADSPNQIREKLLGHVPLRDF